jgi:hypothetical protein
MHGCRHIEGNVKDAAWAKTFKARISSEIMETIIIPMADAYVRDG